MTRQYWLEQMVARIVEGFHPLRLILFGSSARQDAGPDSDVDLLVVMSGPTDKRRTAIAIRRALADIPLPKDIIVTTPAEIQERGDRVGSILKPALREGRVLFQQGDHYGRRR